MNEPFALFIRLGNLALKNGSFRRVFRRSFVITSAAMDEIWRRRRLSPRHARGVVG